MKTLIYTGTLCGQEEIDRSDSHGTVTSFPKNKKKTKNNGGAKTILWKTRDSLFTNIFFYTLLNPFIL